MSRRILSEIWIYPIKSLGGIRLRSSQVLEKGLQYDRRWMLLNSNSEFMTQRAYPKMALFKLSMLQSGFELKHEADTINLSFEKVTDGRRIQTRVWGDPVEVLEVPGFHSAWISDRLGVPCKLVAFPEESPRPIDPKYRLAYEHVSLADGYPLLIIGQSSLDDLNSRMDKPVPMNRFRPNMVFEGGKPYEEDDWKSFMVGKNRFAAVKPCIRCVLTTVDQETGDKGREPLLTLSRYRRREENIYFGENVIPIDFDEIYEGDEITFQ